MEIHGSALIESGPGIREIENKKIRRGALTLPRSKTTSLGRMDSLSRMDSLGQMDWLGRRDSQGQIALGPKDSS